MNEHERRLKIWEMVQEQGSVYVNNLSELFSVSKVTIRGDLEHLEEQGLAKRFRGGITKNTLSSVNDVKKDNDREKVKKEIARKAISYINDYDNIILGSGTTNESLAQEIASSNLKGLTIITNNLMAINHLCRNKNISLIVLGGRYTHGNGSTYGKEAEKSIEGMKVDVMFTGADGLDETGVTSMHEGFSLSATLSKYTSKVIVLTESFKIGKRKQNKVLPLESINVIITESFNKEKVPNELSEKIIFVD